MYYYVLVLLSFGCFLISNLKIKNRAGNLVGASYLLFSTIFIVSSTRYGIGSDYFSYKDIFDYETFNRSKTAFYVTCSNLETGKAEHIRCPEMTGKYMDCLRASASMPFVSQIVMIDGKPYLDGGITDSIPLKAAFNLGFDKNIVITTRPAGYQKKPFALTWLAKIVYKKVLQII